MPYIYVLYFQHLNNTLLNSESLYRHLTAMAISFFLFFFSCFRAAYFRIIFIIFESVLGQGVCQKVTSVTFVRHKKTLPEVVDNFPNLLTLKLNWFQLEAK